MSQGSYLPRRSLGVHTEKLLNRPGRVVTSTGALTQRWHHWMARFTYTWERSFHTRMGAEQQQLLGRGVALLPFLLFTLECIKSLLCLATAAAAS